MLLISEAEIPHCPLMYTGLGDIWVEYTWRCLWRTNSVEMRALEEIYTSDVIMNIGHKQCWRGNVWWSIDKVLSYSCMKALCHVPQGLSLVLSGLPLATGELNCCTLRRGCPSIHLDLVTAMDCLWLDWSIQNLLNHSVGVCLLSFKVSSQGDSMAYKLCISQIQLGDWMVIYRSKRTRYVASIMEARHCNQDTRANQISLTYEQ